MRVPGQRLHIRAQLPGGHAGRIRLPHVQLYGGGGRWAGEGGVRQLGRLQLACFLSGGAAKNAMQPAST